MFDKNYKNAMDSITPSDDVKENVLESLILKEEIARRKNPAIPWRIAFACVACVSLVLGMIFIPRKDANTAKPLNTNAMVKVGSYDEIYEVLKDQKIMAKYYAESEYVTEDALDGAVDFATTSPTADDSAYNGSVDKTDSDYSGTTEQVEGVAEADIVKTDGEYIYYLYGNNHNTIKIFSAQKENTEQIAEIDLSDIAGDNYCDEMFLKDDRLIILQSYYAFSCVGDYGLIDTADSLCYGDECYTSILIYDVSDPYNPTAVSTVCQEGYYNSARMVGDYIYLISNYNINLNAIDQDDPASFVPTTVVNGVIKPVPADDIYCYEDSLIDLPQYAVIGAYSYSDGTMSDSASILGGTHQIYCSQNNIILTKSRYYSVDEAETASTSATAITRIEINDGNLEYKASGEIDGTLENQFFIDEYNGYFRFVTTVTKTEEIVKTYEGTSSTTVSYSTYNTETSAYLAVLDGELNRVGEIADLAPEESVYSVRFMGDVAYFVTFRQVDPLFSADLSDPANPKIIGELKIPGFSEYMYPYGDGLLLGFGQDADETTGRTTGLKLSMFDISDPANVTESDKTVIDDYAYSMALYDHKEMLVSADKNLIGFSVFNRVGNFGYLIYKYNNGAFIRVATFDFSSDYNYIDTRGLFINDAFYTINDSRLDVYDLETFSPIKSLTIQ